MSAENGVANASDALDPAASMSNQDPELIPGERGPSALHRDRSLQSRIGSVFAIGLLSVLTLGLLVWYYVHTFEAARMVHRTAQANVRQQAAGDAPLPGLGTITPPRVLLAKLLGPPPGAPPASAAMPAPPPPPDPPMTAPASVAPPPPSPAALALARRLSGPAFSSAPASPSGGAPAAPVSPVSAASPTISGSGGVEDAPVGAESPSPIPVSGPSDGLRALLTPTITPAVRAEVLPTERLLLPKGSFIDCTLETAIDSTLPGMTTCVTATDTFGADGTTVLLERGTKLVGETRGEVQQGVARVFVLWTEARTPTGVVVPLASPGTDALGRSGLAGHVNRHFWQRFGAAMLVSVIDGAVQSAVASQGNGTVIVNPSTSQDVLTEVLKSTINLPPTVTVNQGARIQVLVARDLDFRSVYELRTRAP